MEAGPAGDPGVGVGAQMDSETVILTSQKMRLANGNSLSQFLKRALSEFGVKFFNLMKGLHENPARV